MDQMLLFVSEKMKTCLDIGHGENIKHIVKVHYVYVLFELI